MFICSRVSVIWKRHASDSVVSRIIYKVMKILNSQQVVVIYIFKMARYVGYAFWNWIGIFDS